MLIKEREREREIEREREDMNSYFARQFYTHSEFDHDRSSVP